MSGGRPPVVRLAVLDAVMQRPSEGLDCKALAQIVGVSMASVRDATCKLRNSGDVHWLRHGWHVRHFGSAADRDAYAAANPEVVVDKPIRRTGEVKNARAPRLLELLRAAGCAGAGAVELSTASGITGGNVRNILTDLLAAGQVWRYGPAHHMRWFSSAEAMADGRRAIDAAVSARRERIVVKRSQAGAASSKKRRAVEEKSFSLAAKKEEDKRVARREAQAANIVWPEHIKIQRAPTPRDGRYSADPGHIGEFMCEWRQLRCGGVT